MKALTREDLMSLEKYADERSAFRTRVLAHKRDRRVALGEHAHLYFEDRLTVQYQVQEMLRIEKIFEAREIDEELGAYNPLIPGGRDWKATFMLEYEDVAVRREALAQLQGVAQRVWMRAGDAARVYAIADEDMGRDNDEKTSSVHFMRFDLTADMVTSAKAGRPITCGIDHAHYQVTVTLEDRTRAALVADLT